MTITTKASKDKVVRQGFGRQSGAGRKPGIPNRATTEFRDTVRVLLEKNTDNVGLWLSMVANGYGSKEADPARALDLMTKLAEFAAPKLARTEIAGDPNAPQKHTISWEK